MNNEIQNIDKKFEEVADIINDSLDRTAGYVPEQEVNKLIEQVQSEVNLEQKSAALEERKNQELYARLNAIRDPRPTKEALKNPAPIPTVEELEARLKKLKDLIPTVEEPQKKVEKSKDNQIKQPQSIKPTTKVVKKIAAHPKDTKLETNSPATSPEPLVKEPSKLNKSYRNALPLSTIKAEQTGWFAKAVNIIINVIIDNIKGFLGNPQIQDAPPKQQSKQVILEKMQADIKKLKEPLAELKEAQEARKQALKVKKCSGFCKRLGRICKRLAKEKHYLAFQQDH